MASYLMPVESRDFSDQIFVFDCDISEGRDDSWKWTQYAIEEGAEISDFGVTEPRTYSLSGIVTAWNAATDDEVYTRLTDIYNKLVEFANTRQPVTLVCGTWCDDVVITKTSAKKSTDGEMLSIDISLQSYQIATYETVEIPPELLAPAVKASAAPAPAETAPAAAGATEEQPAKKKNTSVLANMADGKTPDSTFGVPLPI